MGKIKRKDKRKSSEIVWELIDKYPGKKTSELKALAEVKSGLVHSSFHDGLKALNKGWKKAGEQTLHKVMSVNKRWYATKGYDRGSSDLDFYAGILKSTKYTSAQRLEAGNKVLDLHNKPRSQDEIKEYAKLLDKEKDLEISFIVLRILEKLIQIATTSDQQEILEEFRQQRKVFTKVALNKKSGTNMINEALLTLSYTRPIPSSEINEILELIDHKECHKLNNINKFFTAAEKDNKYYVKEKLYDLMQTDDEHRRERIRPILNVVSQVKHEEATSSSATQQTQENQKACQ